MRKSNLKILVTGTAGFIGCQQAAKTINIKKLKSRELITRLIDEYMPNIEIKEEVKQIKNISHKAREEYINEVYNKEKKRG